MLWMHRYPGGLDPRTGMPRSWKLYVMGSRAMHREIAREMMRLSSAVGITQAAKVEDRQRWMAKMRGAAGEKF